MSTNIEDPKEPDLVGNTASDQVGSESTFGDNNAMPSAQKEEEVVKKKYGGIIPKKPPLLSKDHERAFFDSADWALGKQGAQKPKGPLEALRPKLQPTPHQQVRSRRSAYAPSDDGEDGGNGSTPTSEDGEDDNKNTSEEQTNQQ